MSETLTKVCSDCKEPKGFSNFSPQNGGKFGIHSICKSCMNKRQKKSYRIDIEKSRKLKIEYNKRWKLKNREKYLLLKRQYNISEHLRRYGKDLNYTMKERLRALTRQSLKGNSKSNTTFYLLGCDNENFVNHIKLKMTPDMSWEKIMSGEIHIDHIRPCASFDLSNPAQQRECFHYTNLQPLWAADNIEKSDNLNWRKN